MVDQALEESQEGGLPTRVWRYATGGEVDVAISPADHLLQRGARRVHRQGRRRRSTATRSTRRSSPTPDLARTPSPATTASPSTRASCARGSRRRSRARSAPRRRAPGRPGRSPRSPRTELAAQYPTYLTVDRVDLHADAVEGPEARQEYTVAVGQPAYPTPDRPLLDRVSKQVDPVWSVPNSDWAGELAGTTVAGGAAENPLKSRWMGITDGAGIHGTDEVASLGTRRLARLRAHGGARRRSSSTTRSRSAPRSTSAERLHRACRRARRRAGLMRSPRRRWRAWVRRRVPAPAAELE